MPNPLLDFARSDTQAGYRLERFEFLNWGTFDGRVWSIHPRGDNALLTGDIGSGKSTIVDALTTLLVPPGRITYNKAAGAEGRERSLRSYVMGNYKSEKDDHRLSAKAVSLRGSNQFSVLLAHFVNQGFGLSVTLAQVFWIGDNETQPKRFYLVGEQDMSIKQDFTGFSSIRELKRRLRASPGVTLFDHFSQYAGMFRRKLGIDSSKAMDLFYQTVSMKSVGNLTEFVRGHMLEPADFETKIDDIRRNFDNLNQAHEAVIRAKHQITMLEPLVKDADKHEQESAERRGLIDCRNALDPYIADQKAAMLRDRLVQRRAELSRADDRLKQQQDTLDHLHEQQDKLKQSIASSGGQRLDDIERSINKLIQERASKQQAAQRYGTLCEKAGLPIANDEKQFHANREEAQSHLETIDRRKIALETEQIDEKIVMRDLDVKHRELDTEIKSLEARKSNIPKRSLDLRREMCEVLGLIEDDLPFVGELLRVREEQSRWQGAAERLLHSFGLSLIVPDKHYAAVSRYADHTHLRGRLVYFRVRADGVPQHATESGPALLWRKLQIKPDSEHHAWLERQLARRFDYDCCDDLETFHRMPKAVTAAGQIKAGGERHEKDDRHRIDDPSRYVLGWSNKQKVAALRDQQSDIARQGQQVLNGLSEIESELSQLKDRRDAVRDILNVQAFSEINWQVLAKQIADLEAERQQIEASSDLLKTLRQQLAQTQVEIKQTQEKKEKTIGQRGELKHKIESAELALREATATLERIDEPERNQLFPKLQAIQPQALGDKQVTIENCDVCSREVRDWVQGKIDAVDKRLKGLGEKIIRQMQAYRNAYPTQTREADAALDAADEYRAMLAALVEQDLPRHEAKFKALLNEGTIQEIVLFQGQLARAARDIEEKISQINESLRQIDYNPGTYIRLNCDRSADSEVRAFNADLRACVGETLGGGDDEVYTENKFLQVKKLIDRFNGREGLAELDRKWARKVADVRNWFEFSASELWAEDDKEREFYSDSAGKSGGQKEKLAYTILASALAYQFGLKVGETRSRSFRFVMIDEAFGRGSDESARYGLEIFKKLNLQLLIITPLQKIHIIEDYIQSVHFVHNRDGKQSQLQNLSIKAYREEKQRINANHQTDTPSP